MTNQVNQAFEKWYQSKIDEANENNDMDMRHEFHRNKERYKYGWQAATKARDSEINSLKERVAELQADNLRLREALERIVKAEDNIYKCEDDYQGDVIGKLSDIHFKAYNKARKVLSSTPAQSLAEHELIKSQRDKLLASLKLALIEMMALPHSLGLEITHTIDMELLIKEIEESK